MNYNEAKKFAETYSDLTTFGRYENEGATYYDILFKIISPVNKHWDVKEYMDLNGVDNQKALTNLSLMNEDLRVWMIAKTTLGQFIIEDMYAYLLHTSQLR